MGKGANSDEKIAAEGIADVLSNFNGVNGRTIGVVYENDESPDFWAALGGKTEYAQTAEGDVCPRDPRLFHASTVSGSFRVEEVVNFDQSDLLEEDVFLLDIFTQVFVWVGAKSTHEERDKSMVLAQRFVAEVW